MPINQITPFRQMAKAYGALISLPGVIGRLHLDAEESANHRARGTRDGLSEIRDAIEKLAPPKAGNVVGIHRRLGFNLLLDQSSMLDKHVVDADEWEPEQLAYITMLMGKMYGRHGTVFLDIGSYWGLYSLVASQSGTFKQIHAFEADSHNFAQLQANVFLNNASHTITGHNKAVGDSDGTLFVWDSTTHPDGNRAGVGIVQPTDGFQGGNVESICIDSVIRTKGNHILMKIDVESFEPAVLRGMKRTVEENKVVIQVEIFDENKPAAEREIEALGLRLIHKIYPDHYLTNMTESELGV